MLVLNAIMVQFQPCNLVTCVNAVSVCFNIVVVVENSFSTSSGKGKVSVHIIFLDSIYEIILNLLLLLLVCFNIVIWSLVLMLVNNFSITEKER